MHMKLKLEQLNNNGCQTARIQIYNTIPWKQQKWREKNAEYSFHSWRRNRLVSSSF